MRRCQRRVSAGEKSDTKIEGGETNRQSDTRQYATINPQIPPPTPGPEAHDAELVASKATRQPVETVEAILAAHQDGAPLNRIAATLDVHHSAVKRVLDGADAHRQRHLAAAV